MLPTWELLEKQEQRSKEKLMQYEFEEIIPLEWQLIS